MLPLVLERQRLVGLCTRTCNSDEQSLEKSKIAPLWERFYTEIAPRLQKESAVYGLYYDYASDVHDAFSVLAGTQLASSEEGLETAYIQEGKYLKFSAKGKMPETIINLWAEIWEFFEKPDCRFTRAYKTDFEAYTSLEGLDIYISIE